MHVRCTYGCMYAQYKTTLPLPSKNRNWLIFVHDTQKYENYKLSWKLKNDRGFASELKRFPKCKIHFQNDQGYNSRGNHNNEGFNQESSYRSQYNDQEVEENSSPSSIYTKYLQLQIRMLKQTTSLHRPSINSDELSASQSCSSNSSQLGYIQTTPCIYTNTTSTIYDRSCHAC